MEIDFRNIPPQERYKLLVGSVTPRPIALVTTVDADGNVNAAPYSFFNAMCNDPPALAIGVNRSLDARRKDTAANVDATGELVVNLVDEAIAEPMNICEVDFPPGVDELAKAGLTAAKSTRVRPPRIAEAPIAFECKLIAGVSLAPGKLIIIAEALQMHIRDDLYDAKKNYVLADRMRLIGRMHGAGWYARTSDLFEMPRLSAVEKKERFGLEPEAAPPRPRKG